MVVEIQKRILVDEDDKPIAVQIDVATFSKIESVLEDYALGQLIAEVAEDDVLDLKAAKAYCEGLSDFSRRKS
ncbi:MAG: hypothetical protein COS88_04410 [Chloroflexi bacterium CG07_land_8_20_14_0_80_51_10]|nr:MAG: hypothetical protein COS88_04410 [Chloroflexi bacterium CG07_land_8_20_14_0_80_51_10]